jgi:hypothetical protein
MDIAAYRVREILAEMDVLQVCAVSALIPEQFVPTARSPHRHTLI